MNAPAGAGVAADAAADWKFRAPCGNCQSSAFGSTGRGFGACALGIGAFGGSLFAAGDGAGAIAAGRVARGADATGVGRAAVRTSFFVAAEALAAVA